LTNFPGNKEFAEQVSAWVFQEKGLIRIKSTNHHRLGEKDQHGIYRIKDNMVSL
jgi:oligosaccharyltransferase complex subunit beta